jgi:nucleotidyltransferase substrate binding protein (TIGR01987 family)
MNDRGKLALQNLGQALDRLEEVLNVSPSENNYVIDATIQRFEFVIELYWKTFKHLLAAQGKTTSLPKASLQEAYAAGWICDEKLWLNMMRDRNLTSHTYKEKNAQEIYKNIRTYYPEMRQVYRKLCALSPS